MCHVCLSTIIYNYCSGKGLPNRMPGRPGLPSFHVELPEVVSILSSLVAREVIRTTKANKDFSTPAGIN